MNARGEHPSDHPGDEQQHTPDADMERHPHTGRRGPSVPRRAGTGERQAERRHYTGDDPGADEPMIPGQIIYRDDPVVINAGSDVVTVRVENAADRPVQVGSHYHFAEVNPALVFDRKVAWGRRLNVLSGGSMRFEPGAVEEVSLIPIKGRRVVAGLRGECGGALDD